MRNVNYNLPNNMSDLAPDAPPIQRKIKPLSEHDLKHFGLNKETITIVDTLETLSKQPPNIIIADCVRNIGFIQNYFKEQKLFKKKKYVMGLGVYQQLYFDMERNVKILKPSKIKFKDLYRPYKGQNLDDKTLLVSRHGGIGDLLFIQPNLRYIKEKYPTCIIKFCCGPQYHSMIETWDCIDEILDLPFTLQHFVTADYHGFFEGVIERCREAEKTNAYNIFSKWMGLNLPNEKLIPIQNPKEDKINECSKILEDWGVEKKKFILMQLRASSPIRCPNPELWMKIIKELSNKGYNILLTDNPKQADGIERFISRINENKNIFNFCKYSKSLDYTIAMASLANMGICTDSALIHICASVGTSIFGLYGPFPADIRLSTYKNADWIEAKTKCTSCFRHGHKPCPEAEKKGIVYSPCYDTININEMIEKVEKLYQGI